MKLNAPYGQVKDILDSDPKLAEAVANGQKTPLYVVLAGMQGLGRLPLSCIGGLSRSGSYCRYRSWKVATTQCPLPWTFLYTDSGPLGTLYSYTALPHFDDLALGLYRIAVGCVRLAPSHDNNSTTVY
jgi:hypothetical protein